MSFCVAVNCMDGRVQRPVLDFLERKFHAQYVDMVTEPGPNGILASQDNPDAVASLLQRVDISLSKHAAVGIAVIGHFDCSGNPGDRSKQDADTGAAVRFLRGLHPDTAVIGIWVGPDWLAEEIDIP